MKPFESDNFCRVFEFPPTYPKGFCFNGGISMQIKMVDWFNPWPDEIETWEEVETLLIDFLKQKIYVKPKHRYVLVTDFGKSLVFEGE